MPTPPSKTKQRAGRNEERHRLHEAVDRILDGPDDRAMDAWVRQALVDLGFLVRVAAPALDYEVGRTISGVSRRHGNFPINLSWEGAELSVSSEQAKAWVAAGEAARYERLPSEIRQQALAALLHPIANISCHTWLHDLVIGFDALRFGHVTPLLQRSNRRLWGSVNAWRQRLDALRWVEFQIAAGKIKKRNDALDSVAREFGARFHTVKGWRKSAEGVLGRAVVREELDVARQVGKHVCHLNGKIVRGEANERENRWCIHIEGAYSREFLKELGERFRAPSKKH